MSLDKNVEDLLKGAPELQQTPGLALGLAQGTLASGAPLDVQQVGQSAGLALIGAGVSQANQETQQFAASAPKPVQNTQHVSGGLFGSIGHFFGHAVHDATHNPVTNFVGNDVVKPLAHDVNNDVIKPVVRDVVAPVATVMNAGLNEVTHTYRYIHDVWERHGVWAALGEMALIGAGAAAGVFLAPEALVGGAVLGGILGGEAVGDIAGRLGYRDSWNATANGATYHDAQGWHVSPGRDLVRLLGVITGNPAHHDAQGNVEGGLANFVSGATDFTFDVSLDPTIKLGSLYRAGKMAARAPRALADWSDVEGGAELARRPLVDQEGILPNNIQRIYQNNGAVRNAFERIAGMDTRQVLSQYPQLAPMAKALGAASTGQEVADAFEMALTNRNYSFAKYGLPATSLTRRLLGRAGLDVPTPAGVSTAIQSKFSRVATDSTGKPIVSKVTGNSGRTARQKSIAENFVVCTT
jgi:hypothetical protein